MAQRDRLSTFERACFAVIGVGLASRLLVFRFRSVDWDAMWYLTMGKSLVEHGEFTSPWLEQTTYTHHFPPAYPALDALAYAVAGPSFIAAGIVSVLVATFLVAVSFFTTRDLYGRPRAFAVAAITATSTALIQLDIRLLSESLVAAFFALTIWGILKSLDRPRYILVAGIFAGLGYLTKASMGPFFLLAGAGGFAWRFYYVRWRVFRDRWYVGAGLIFGTFVLFWAGRNVRRHGWPNWETQPHASEALQHLFARPDWPLILGGETLWGLVLLSALALAFMPEIVASFREIRDERTSALWLAIITPCLIGLIFAAAFASLESQPIVSSVAVRYLITPIVPLLWLGIRRWDFTERAPSGPPNHGAELLRARRGWLIAGTSILAFLHFANPIIPVLTLGRLVIYVLGCALGIGFLLLARGYAWTPHLRMGGSGEVISWRATRAPLEGAPHAGLVLGAFAFAIAIGLFVAFQLLPLLVPLAASLAAGSPRARILVLVACAAVVPMSFEEVETGIIRVSEGLNDLAAEGAIIAALPGQEFYVYPWLRPDLEMVTPDRPHDWFVMYGGAELPPSGLHRELVREYTVNYVGAPGAEFAWWFWGGILGQKAPDSTWADARLFRVSPPTPDVA